jgi:predicted dehydrogenase
MSKRKGFTRRQMLGGMAAVTASVLLPSRFFAQGSDQMKIGIIGCGGRGAGAAVDAITAHPSVVIWAMGDLFRDRLEGTKSYLRETLKERFQVTSEREFTGFDNYLGVIASEVDVVILTSPPGFRPTHLKAAVEANKHVFMEKPVAVDAQGVRTVIEAGTQATTKSLKIVAGTQRRYDVAYQQAMDQIHNGAIGDVVALYAYWNQGGLWINPKKDEWSDMEWQIRNWLYFTWLSGDHIVEQHIHNLDVCNWVMQAHPIKAMGMGGRQVRVDSVYGHIYDHFAVEYEYENGVRMLSMCRQIDGTSGRINEHIVGTKGNSNANTTIRGEKNWKFDGERPNPYVEEHKTLFDCIRNGKQVNECKQIAESTLTAIMGREAAYTGQEINWEQALNSEWSLVPEKLEFGPIETPPVPMPGKYRMR